MSKNEVWDDIVAKLAQNSRTILGDYQNFYQTGLTLLTNKIHHSSNADEVLACGKISCMRFFKSDKESAEPVLIIPSMINKADILDINSENSLCVYLKKEINVYLIEWHNLTTDIEIDTYLDDIKLFIAELYKQHNQKVKLIGYCLGGNLACASYFSSKDMIEKVALIATPWDFSKLSYNMPFPLNLKMDYIPAGFLTFYLNSINLDKIIEKYSKFSSKTLNEKQIELFMKVEYWANNGINLPLSLAKTIYQDLFMQNQTMHCTWQVAGELIDAKKIEIPAMVISTDNDKIVSKASAEAITKYLPNYQLVSSSCGHVGVIISQKSKESIWPKLAKFLLSKESS